MSNNTEPTADFDRTVMKLMETIPKIHWGRLRFIGSVRTLSLSFLISLATALPDLRNFDPAPLMRDSHIALSFVGFIIGFGLANLCYEIYCPAIIRRFESLPDFYQHQLTIKQLQMATYANDPFEAGLLHVTQSYVSALKERTLARYVTLSLYVLGFVAFVAFLVLVYGSASTSVAPSS
jgi:hypothetical protein